MRVMMIGGTGFIGRHAVGELLESNHDVALVHRGRTQLADEGCLAKFICEHSMLAGMRGELEAWSPDVVVDFILGSAEQAAVPLGEPSRGLNAKRGPRHLRGRFYCSRGDDHLLWAVVGIQEGLRGVLGVDFRGPDLGAAAAVAVDFVDRKNEAKVGGIKGAVVIFV